MPVFNITDPVSVGLSTRADHYHRVFNNTLGLYAGETGIVGAAAGDDPYFSTATQLSPGARQLRQSFRGLRGGTHPDADKAAYQLLYSCKEAVMQDGTRVADWSNILFDITVSGEGGLDASTEQASTHYEPYLIRKSSNGAKAGLLHRAKDYFLDEQNTTATTTGALRDASGQTKRAETFDVDVTGPCEKIQWKLTQNGSVSGRIWMSIYATSAGLPTGAAIKTSRKLNAANIGTAQVVEFVFDDPATLTAGTTYAMVLEGDYTISGTNYISFDRSTTDPYAAGQLCAYDGSAWTGSSVDAWFKVFITQNDTALSLPSGYDQYCHIGHVYNDSGSNFVPFIAKDNYVMTQGAVSGLASVASSALSLVDASAKLPPCPVLMETVGSSNTADDGLYFSPLDLGASSWRTIVSLPTASRYYFGLLMLVEAQSFYIQRGVGSGTVTCYVRGYWW